MIDLKRLSLIVVAGVSAVGLALSVPAAASAPRTADVPVDGQAYVTDTSTTNPSDGTAFDVYGGDQSVTHVAMHGGGEMARSFVHFALDYLPANANPQRVTLTLHVAAKTDASSKGVYNAYNVNTAAAIIEACPLSTPFPATFDAANPPGYDCAPASAIGKPNKAGDVWTFALDKLLGFWKSHGNTGLALVPIAADPSATWSVSFSRPKAATKVTFVLVPRPHATGGAHGSGGTPSTTGSGAVGGTPSGPTSAGTPPAGSDGSSSGPSTVVPPLPTGQATTAVSGAQPPAVAGQQQSTPVAATASTSSDGGNGMWPWVLVGCVLVAAGAVGVAHRDAVLAAVNRIVPPGLAAFRAHPRAYSVASAALAWGLVFTSYSLVTAPKPPAGPQLADAQNNGITSANGAAPTATAAPGVPGQPVRPGTAAGGSGGSTAGGVTTGGSTTTGSVTPAQEVVKQEFAGTGTWRTINNIPVFFPADGGPPVAKLYSGADDVAGLTSDSLRLCAHAATTYGPAFHISASDLDVYWNSVNDHGGIFGRKVVTSYQNDNYDPGQAVTAAQACKDWGTFMLLGGIGFDQIPAVRQWAEQNHMLYLHHIATINGTSGQRFSFSSLPTVEQLGTWFGQLAIQKFKDKKIGIIYRQSANWEPGYQLFKKTIQAAGMQIVGEYGTTVNQANYTQEIAQLNTSGAQVVFAWENALAVTEMLKQAQGQNYHPAWLLFPFNLTTNTLGDSTLDQDIWGIATWDAYDPGYYGGGFAPYAAQIKEFEAQYKQYDPGADLSGDGGDLLFLNWEAQKGLHALLTACGKDCTRNKIAGLLLAGWHKPVPPNCPADFAHTGDHHHGGFTFNVFHAVRDPNGRPNFVPTNRCITGL